MEAEMVNAGTKLIIKDKAQSQVGEHTEKLCLVDRRQSCTLEKKGCGHLP